MISNTIITIIIIIIIDSTWYKQNPQNTHMYERCCFKAVDI